VLDTVLLRMFLVSVTATPTTSCYGLMDRSLVLVVVIIVMVIDIQVVAADADIPVFSVTWCACYVFHIFTGTHLHIYSGNTRLNSPGA